MARIDTDFVSVLNAVTARLISQVTLADGETYLEASTCFVWLDSQTQDPPPPSSSDLFVTVDVDGGDFDADLFEGGGSSQVTERTNIAVTVHSTNRLDADQRDGEFLTNSNAIMPMAKKVLKALSGHDLVVSGSDTALREQLRPAGRGKPTRSPDKKYGRLTLLFATSFDWDLS